MKNEIIALMVFLLFIVLSIFVSLFFVIDFKTFFVSNEIETEPDKLSSSITFIGHAIIIASLIRAIFNK